MELNRIAKVFRDIYLDKKWHSSESVSGWGSEPGNTKRIVRELPDLFRRYNVTSVLDVPCEDFNWMRHVDLEDIDYLGVDIVPELVHANQAIHGPSKRRLKGSHPVRNPGRNSGAIEMRMK